MLFTIKSYKLQEIIIRVNTRLALSTFCLRYSRKYLEMQKFLLGDHILIVSFEVAQKILRNCAVTVEVAAKTLTDKHVKLISTH